jgi:proteasome lid subunit RPN8/RPN11
MSTSDKYPWTHGHLRIARSALVRVDEDALAAYARDEESCGVMTGPASEPLLVDEALPMLNRATKLHQLDPEAYPRTGRTSFDIDPLMFERALRAGETNGRPVKVLFHSHLEVGAYFSETDEAAATLGGTAPAYPLAYLVTSVRQGKVDDRKLFVWDGSAFVEAPMFLE